LIQHAADVMEAIRPLHLGPLAQPRNPYADAPAPADAQEAERRAVTDLLGPVAVPVDEMVRQSGFAPATVQTILLELELGGRLERHAGGKVSSL
jgi:DNA processing protein